VLALVLCGLALNCAGDPPAETGPPLAAAPVVDSGHQGVGSGALSLALDPGQAKDIDPIGLATSIRVQPPACSDFLMAFTWQVQSPAQDDGAKVDFVGQHQSASFEVAPAAAHGSGSVDCALLQAVNVSKVPIVLQLRFTITTARH
jgi:hypothetical protein